MPKKLSKNLTKLLSGIDSLVKPPPVMTIEERLIHVALCSYLSLQVYPAGKKIDKNILRDALANVLSNRLGAANLYKWYSKIELDR
jgi:hypothetical protein